MQREPSPIALIRRCKPCNNAGDGLKATSIALPTLLLCNSYTAERRLGRNKSAMMHLQPPRPNNMRLLLPLPMPLVLPPFPLGLQLHVLVLLAPGMTKPAHHRRWRAIQCELSCLIRHLCRHPACRCGAASPCGAGCAGSTARCSRAQAEPAVLHLPPECQELEVEGQDGYGDRIPVVGSMVGRWWKGARHSTLQIDWRLCCLMNS